MFVKELGNCENVTEFSPQAFGVLVESVIVKKNGEIEFSFIDGDRVKV